MAYRNPQDQRDYAMAHYAKNSEAYKKRAMLHKKQARKDARSFVRQYLEEHPCLDCGEPDPIVLEFDHRDPSSKDDAVANLLRRAVSLKRVQQEIAKCDVRCANCHRRKTHRDRLRDRVDKMSSNLEEHPDLFCA